MNRTRKSIAAAVVSGAVAASLGGSALLLGAAEHPKANPQQIATANDMSSVFREVGKTVEPSVVQIRVHKVTKGAAQGSPLDNDQLRRFFKDNPGFEHMFPQVPQLPGNGNGPDDEGGYDQVGTGSGVIMEVDGKTGYILTNNHVAGGATEMDVTLNDGRTINNAQLVGADPKADLAVVKITADNLVPARWGDESPLHQGDWVMAFGSPFGYVGSMTHGIVSALDRSNVGILGANGYEDFIQVDAPINPGNSGGPLVNLQGEVVGINTAIASHTGAFSGIGFAIPAREAKFVYTALKDHGKVVRGWLGVSIGDIAHEPKLAQSFGYKNTTGVLVESTLPGAPAAGKLQSGDIIESINGKPVENVLQLRNQVAAMAPDTELNLTVFRDGKNVPVSLKLGTQPQDMTVLAGDHGPAHHEASVDALGLSLSNATDELAKQFKVDEDRQGALITHVKPGSPADQAGLRPGQMITQVGNTKVKNAEEANDLLTKQDLKTGVRLYVVSPEGARYAFVQAQ
jgi:serine protease Do